MIILVAFRFADRHRQRQIQRPHKRFEVGRILPGRVNPQMDVRLGMLAVQLFQPPPQLLVPAARLADRQRRRGRLFVIPQKADMMPVPRRVDPHAQVPDRFRDPARCP